MDKMIKHSEKELIALKQEINSMWQLVLSQLQKCKLAYLAGNVELAHEVVIREKSVNSFELSIDTGCENYMALFSPVAMDLRLIISLIKISTTLERIADFADGIARHVIEGNSMASEAMKEDLKVESMFDAVISMLSDSFVALESENTKISGKILQKDDEIDKLYEEGKQYLAEYIQKDPGKGQCVLDTFLTLRKIERIGDHCCNIVEEIVFYIDAKVLKHSKGRSASKKAESNGSEAGE
ncbi:MAG: phosphate signaling complex protein PhoU [Candidatus Fibromonas sp.]|jgi:phosphate transport system protein|nr:phosphate signaling complex protein PhoU [Candidatus Fibromonas sp.]